MLQASVDRIANNFKVAVRAGRRGHKISDDVMQGQSMSADDAMRAGLIDSVADMSDVMRDIDMLKTMRRNNTGEQ
jgi:ClpP class serine protease